MSDRTMRCAICNQVKHWRDGFPISIYAECWTCTWERHVEMNHKPRRKWHVRWPFYRDPLDPPSLVAAQVDTDRDAAAAARAELTRREETSA